MKWTVIFTLLSGVVFASDWPTYQHDNRRSGITADQLDVAQLSQKWVFTANTPPQPAWRGKMERDSYGKKIFQADTYDYDKSFNLIAVDRKVFFASSSGNACVALDDSTGKELWRASVTSPVRVAPAYDQGKVYFSSDDGYAYCVHAKTGKVIWKYRGALTDTMIASNHKFISRNPSRTGVLVDSGNAYCGFGMMSWNGNIMVQLDAATGKEKSKFVKMGPGFSFEGTLLSDGKNLFVTQGRNAPVSFQMKNPITLNGKFPGCGGTFATLSSDGHFFHGPGHARKQKVDHTQESDASSRADVAKLNFVSRIIIQDKNRFTIVRDAVQARGSHAWIQGVDQPVTMIFGGKTLYVGAKNQVVVINATNGNVLKILPVDGSAYSLAIANGKLFVSTTTGKIYGFQ